MQATTKAVAAAALLFAALPAAAQPYGPGYGPGYGPAERSFEITPYAGYRFGGDFDNVDFDDFFFGSTDIEVGDGGSFGVIFDARLAGGLFLELWASRQDSELTASDGLFLPVEALFDLEVDYYHAGLLYQWTPGQVRPFFAASVGATRFAPAEPGLDDLVRPSLSLGGGAKLMFSEAVGLRLEGRLISTWVDEDDERFCNRRRCFDFDEDVYFYQVEARAGLVVAF